MKKPFRWFFVAVCMGLLLIFIFIGPRVGGFHYAKMRLLCLGLHRGMSTTNVARLLGHASKTTSERTISGTVVMSGEDRWYCSSKTGDQTVRKLTVRFNLQPDGSEVLSNWAWSEE
jgi:hypothetical protein